MNAKTRVHVLIDKFIVIESVGIRISYGTMRTMDQSHVDGSPSSMQPCSTQPAGRVENGDPNGGVLEAPVDVFGTLPPQIALSPGSLSRPP